MTPNDGWNDPTCSDTRETVETVLGFDACPDTRLKPGVNERVGIVRQCNR